MRAAYRLYFHPDVLRLKKRTKKKTKQKNSGLQCPPHFHKASKQMDGKVHRKVLSPCSQFHTSISVIDSSPLLAGINQNSLLFHVRATFLADLLPLYEGK